MSKRILSTVLVLLMCLSFSIPAFAAGTPTVSASYSAGVVSISGTDYSAGTAYIVRIVDTANSSVTAMAQTTADRNGNISASVTTGALGTLPNYAAYINDLSGTSMATGSLTGSAAAYYTITFDANGGSVSPTGAQTGADGKLTSLPTPARINYRFDGWFTAASAGTQITAAGTVFSADGTIYAHWTYTGGSSGGHHNNGGGGGSGSGTTTANPSVPALSENTFVSDTTQDFSVNGAYQFRITGKNGAAPNFVVGTAGVFSVQLVKVSGSDYYFKLIAIGQSGAKAGIYINGVRLLVATVSTATSTVRSDTTALFKVTSRKTYVFRLTADRQPAFGSGNSSVFRVVFIKAVGKDYFFQVTAVGKPGQAAGFYINSDKAPVAVATIA